MAASGSMIAAPYKVDNSHGLIRALIQVNSSQVNSSQGFVRTTIRAVMLGSQGPARAAAAGESAKRIARTRTVAVHWRRLCPYDSLRARQAHWQAVAS